MTHQRSEKETRYLREIVGEDGQKVHYFNPDTKHRETRSAAQVKQMRAATGGKKATTAREKARAAKQVAEMRAAACPAALGLLPDAGGLTREQVEAIKARNGIGREDAGYINPARL